MARGSLPDGIQAGERTLKHSPRFLALVDKAKAGIEERTVSEVKGMLDRGEAFKLVDVREESEWAKGRLPKAIHIGKGVIERDIEEKLPDLDARIVLYCGGGYRSALAADALKKMGYRSVVSMDGGFRGWQEAGYPIAS